MAAEMRPSAGWFIPLDNADRRSTDYNK